MSFWEDSSPIVKGAVVIGVVGLLYFAAAFAIGLFPFAGGCTHVPEGQEEAVAGCQEGATCSSDGECVVNNRGVQR